MQGCCDVSSLSMEGSYDLALAHARFCAILPLQGPYDLTLAHAGLLWCFILAHAEAYDLTLTHAGLLCCLTPCPCRIVVMFHPCPCRVLLFNPCPCMGFCAVLPLPMQGPYDLTLTHAGLRCFTLAHDLTLAHAWFLCRLTLAHTGVVAMFHPGPCRFLWFNLCPCGVLCRLTLALAGFLWFNTWTFAREYTVYMNYMDLAVRCLRKVLNLFARSLTLLMQSFLSWFTRSPPPMNGYYELISCPCRIGVQL